MSKPSNKENDDDTGQRIPRNEEIRYQNVQTEKKREKMVKNQQSYADLHGQSNDNETSNGSDIDKNDEKNDNRNVEMEDEVEDRNKEVELEK